MNEGSLTIENLYDQHSTDTNSFISPSEENHWSISIDSTSYFMLNASEIADSYFIALDFSSELKLYNESGNLIVPFNDNISLQNVAGCSNIRVRQVYSDLDGLYLASLYNPNVTTVNLIFINDNKFLHQKFRFRFFNYATLSGNFDHWNLDYVLLDKFNSVSDTNELNDVAFVGKHGSLLKR